VVEDDGVIVGVGKGFTITKIDEEVAEQPLVSVTFTE
jgi:hypothetical protein